jgi:hypothetical protein
VMVNSLVLRGAGAGVVTVCGEVKGKRRETRWPGLGLEEFVSVHGTAREQRSRPQSVNEYARGDEAPPQKGSEAARGLCDSVCRDECGVGVSRARVGGALDIEPVCWQHGVFAYL